MGKGTGLHEQVQRRLDALVNGGREIGVQVAAYLDGRLIVNAAAGLADEATGAPVTPDTPFLNFASGKGLASTVVHLLAERGELDYDLRVADVWPEYGRHGKQDTTLRHLLLHEAGVPWLPAYTMPEDLVHWDKMCRSIAGAQPVWEPGTRHGLHEWTYGWLLGEVVRRVTHRPISQVLAEEVAHPLGVDRELFFGVPPALVHRVARLKDRSWSAALDRLSARVEHFDRVFPPGVRPDASLANRRDLMRADIPSTAVMSARGIARVYAALMGEVDGVRLISPERLKVISTVETTGPDHTIGADLPKTLGYAAQPGSTRIGWSSAGGGLTGFHPELGLAVAAMRNHLSGDHDDPLEDIAAAVHAVVAAA
ncbi:serine hydrolase domain-containing protein [Actinoplanes sp. NPDC049681]|uniref:serine hydrolase domain-containing protein n=1 Tax=Actinoplanes sp. NPDC049681 TaxID=3363905 RepID=UPI0037965708